MDDPRKRLPARDQFLSLARRDGFLGFGCGAILGGVLGFLGAAKALEGSLGTAMATAFVVAAVLGSLCAIFGDGLIERIVRWMDWWG
jgi:hypothetical protein